MPEELTADQARRIQDPHVLGFETTRDLSPLEMVVGQPRAIEALEFGLAVNHPGYNIYVSGPVGVGKTTAVTGFLTAQASSLPTPPDVCYVHNFSDAFRPRVVELPAGMGRKLQQTMRALLQEVRQEMPRAFESDEYAAQRDASLQDIQRQREDLALAMNQEALSEGFAIQPTPAGLYIQPVIDGKPVEDQVLAAMPQEERDQIRQRQEALSVRFRDSMKGIRSLQRKAQNELQALNRQVAQFVVSEAIDDAYALFEDSPNVLHYLHQVQEEMTADSGVFLPSQPQGDSPQDAGQALAREAAMRKYQVNLFVDHSENGGAPVVYELNPYYPNLFGRIEKEAMFGTLQTDFTLIKCGALHQANGGFLVIAVEELLRNPMSYDALKRSLRSGQIAMEDPIERTGMILAKSLQPEPVPLNMKVVLVGSPNLYYLLLAQDEDFRELFKVKAEFDTSMERDEDNLRHYVGFICGLSREEGLYPLNADAVAKIVEEGSRLADDQTKLSTRFSELANILREANQWATVDGEEYTSADHVTKAVRHRAYRSNLIEERIQEVIRKDIFRVETSGEAVGQINGLSVMSLGDHSFGRPARVTATVGLGQAGLLDIEREARMGGAIHTKGVLILGGFLSQRYAYDKPLALSARLVFEQSYEGIDGDSASSTELYALLSALSGLPIQQRFAVTGSVDQQGHVQAIGGANQKIEGYFDVCAAKGLTGDQGVLIPRSNVQNLMLREDVVEAIAEGKFHIHPVDTIDHGIEILTGSPGGERQPDGSYANGTVNYLVDQRLRTMAEQMRNFGKSSKEGQAAPEEE